MSTEPFSRPILDSIRDGYIVHPGDDHQSAIHYDTLEGPDRQWPHHLVVTDVRGILLIRAMLKEREEHISRIAELQDAATSAKERYDADLQSLRDELEKANRGNARLDAIEECVQFLTGENCILAAGVLQSWKCRIQDGLPS